MGAMDKNLKRKGPMDSERALTVAQRQAAMDSARASCALEGLEVSPEGKEIQQKWVRGEVSIDECIAEIKSLYPYRAGRKMSSR